MNRVAPSPLWLVSLEQGKFEYRCIHKENASEDEGWGWGNAVRPRIAKDCQQTASSQVLPQILSHCPQEPTLPTPWSPELWDNEFPLFKPPSLQYCYGSLGTLTQWPMPPFPYKAIGASLLRPLVSRRKSLLWIFVALQCIGLFLFPSCEFKTSKCLKVRLSPIVQASGACSDFERKKNFTWTIKDLSLPFSSEKQVLTVSDSSCDLKKPSSSSSKSRGPAGPLAQQTVPIPGQGATSRWPQAFSVSKWQQLPDAGCTQSPRPEICSHIPFCKICSFLCFTCACASLWRARASRVVSAWRWWWREACVPWGIPDRFQMVLSPIKKWNQNCTSFDTWKIPYSKIFLHMYKNCGKLYYKTCLLQRKCKPPDNLFKNKANLRCSHWASTPPPLKLTNLLST